MAKKKYVIYLNNKVEQDNGEGEKGFLTYDAPLHITGNGYVYEEGKLNPYFAHTKLWDFKADCDINNAALFDSISMAWQFIFMYVKENEERKNSISGKTDFDWEMVVMEIHD